MSRIGPARGERLEASVRPPARTGRAPGSALVAVAAWLLALIGGGALFVSFSAQYSYIVTVRRQDAASGLEVADLAHFAAAWRARVAAPVR